MIVFVSYARRDHDPDALRRIEAAVTSLGVVYVDDVHGHEAADRRAVVLNALHAAAVFVGVVSPHYLRTPWTWREFVYAINRGIPIMALLPDGRLIKRTEVAWPWPREAAMAGQSDVDPVLGDPPNPDWGKAQLAAIGGRRTSTVLKTRL